MSTPRSRERDRRFEFVLSGGRRWRLGPRPAIMGIINVTPDSFSDGGLHEDSRAAVDAGLRMVHDGTDLLDVGGESTRPGACDVSAEEQLRRVIPVVEGLRSETDLPISVDTRLPEVGSVALEAGADIINEVSGCRDPGWGAVLRRWDAPVILMHMRGTPADMQSRTDYPRGVIVHIVEELSRRMESLLERGVARERMILDPGIGFAKDFVHNLQILNGLEQLLELGRPLLVGVSRKSFLGRILEEGIRGAARPASERDVATVAANALAVMRGASILRVHNVAYTRDLVDVLAAIQSEDAGLAMEPGAR